MKRDRDRYGVIKPEGSEKLGCLSEGSFGEIEYSN